MFAGYLSPPRRRAEVLPEGWFLTGDLAHRDTVGVDGAGLVVVRGEDDMALVAPVGPRGHAAHGERQPELT